MVLGLGAKGWILLKKQVPVNFLRCARRGDVCDAPKETKEHKRRAHDLLNDSLYRIGSQVKRELVICRFHEWRVRGGLTSGKVLQSRGVTFFPGQPQGAQEGSTTEKETDLMLILSPPPPTTVRSSQATPT